MKELKYFGHACFMLKDNDTTIIFDPFLKDNPANPEPNAVNTITPDYILISHGHFDHVGDAVAIAKRAGSTIISTAEVCHLMGEKGCEKTAPMHLGGKTQFPFGYVRVTPAFHGAGVPGGHACGFIVNFKGTTVYFAGDTALFGDMALLGKLEKIDYALLPIGSNFTMGPEDAELAAEMLKAKTVIPMHYNTWDIINQDPEQYKKMVESSCASKVQILKFGETLKID